MCGYIGVCRVCVIVTIVKVPYPCGISGKMAFSNQCLAKRKQDKKVIEELFITNPARLPFLSLDHQPSNFKTHLCSTDQFWLFV